MELFLYGLLSFVPPIASKPTKVIGDAAIICKERERSGLASKQLHAHVLWNASTREKVWRHEFEIQLFVPCRFGSTV